MAKKGTALDTTIFEMVLDNGDVGARLRLAAQLTELALNAQAPLAERMAIQPTLARLAQDSEREVRLFMARKLAAAPDLADEVVFGIIAGDPDAALGFIGQARTLTQERMLAIVRVGDPGRQMIVASRGDITADVVSMLCETGEAEAVEAMLDNPAVDLSKTLAKVLYRRFSAHEGIIERLLARPDIPAMIRVLQARVARERLAGELAEKRWIPVNRAEELLHESEERALTAICAGALPEERTELSSFLIHRRSMTGSLLLRLAARGEAGFIEVVLMHLAHCRKPGNPARLVRRAKLPEACGLIVRLALEAAREGHKPSESFGIRIIERLALAGDATPVALRARALSLLMEAGGQTTRQVAEALREELGLIIAA